MSSEQIVIIGGGHAAAEVVTALRRQGWTAGIVMISEETVLPYQRPPLSKAYLQGALEIDRLFIRPQSVYDKAEAEIVLATRVARIDRQKRHVVTSDGDTIDYSHLIIATGTRPRLLPLEGADLANVFYLRSLEDVDRIKPHLKEDARLLIVGAGYIGLEVAASATKLGLKVTVLEAMDRVLARVTGEKMSAFYQSLHLSHGVDLRLNTRMRRFKQTGALTEVELEDGEKIPFDVAVVGIGVLPNVELAEDAGLGCDNGIVVNEFCQTEDANIYAIGDCCNHPSKLYQRNIRLESVPNAAEQAKTAAASICGSPKAYDQVPWFWSDQYDVKLQTAGLLTGFDESITRGDLKTPKFSVFYLQKGRLIAMDAVNSPADFMLSKQLIAKGVKPDKKILADADVSLKTLLGN